MAHPDTAGFTGRIALGLLIGLGAALGQAQPLERGADALLAIDQHRASVVERIVDTWGAALAKSSAYVSIDELRARLLALRADRLLAASLAGTLDGLREMIGDGSSSILAKPGLAQTKALGDSTGDVVYTPVTPCRLVETRGTFAAVYQGNGSAAHTPVPFTPNQIRSYTVQGGNGVCLTQLPAGLNPSAVQLQVFGLPTTPASGDLEILPQGASFGSTATMVYVGTIAFNTVSTATKVNLANHQISVQVRGGGAHLAIDVVGYFAAPTGSGGKFFQQGGNAYGATATLGTTDNQPLNIHVNEQRVMRYEPNATSPNVVGGHPNNSVDVGSLGQTIGGGGNAAHDCLEPSTGQSTRSCANVAGLSYSTVGGGMGNMAGIDPLGSGGSLGTVGGGGMNTASGSGSTIAGGLGNIASQVGATVGGGERNSASELDATVAGGGSNTAANDGAAIGGGSANTAAGAYSTIAGGYSNDASNSYAAVAGGVFNSATGFASVVAGGFGNAANGPFSFAAGRRAKATTTGSFIWADSRDFDFQPSVSNFFGARATGGVGFTVAIDPNTGGVTQFCNLLPGVASWQCTSDREAKENFRPIDGEEILQQLVALPLSTWNFKGADPRIRLLGPTAQDFHAAFGLGDDDKTIVGTNLHGVALAAIQGLHRGLQKQDARLRASLIEKDAQIRGQQREIAALQQRIADLEGMRSEMVAIQATLAQLRRERGFVATRSAPPAAH